jgi:chromosome segregation ATPase
MEILQAAGAVIISAGTGAVTWFFSRKQSAAEVAKLEQEIKTMQASRESEVQSTKIEIMEKYRDLYNNIVEDLGKQLEGLKHENETIRKEVAERRELTDKMVREMRNVESEVLELRAEMAKLKSDFPCVDCPRRSR